MPCTRCFSAALLALSLFLVSPLSSAVPQQLIVTGSSTWQPFSFINKNGEPDGIMVDYWKLYAKANDVTVKFHLLPWSESLQYTRNTPNVIHGGLGYTSERAKSLAFSRQLPLKPYNVNLFVQKDIPYSNLYLLNSSTVGTVKESAKHDFLVSRIPERNIKQFPTFGSLNEAAYRGEVDVFIDDLSTALYDMHHTGNSGLFTPRSELYSFPLHFAIQKSSKQKISNIEQGIDNISKESILAIYDKWLPEDKLYRSLPWLNKTTRSAIFLVSILLLCIGLAGYRKRLQSRTTELKCAVQALNDSKQQLKTAVQNDPVTGAKTRHQFFMSLTEKRFSSNPHVVAVLDVDALKYINKKYGQDVGDIALKHLAKQLRLRLPTNAMLARLGGGEFALIFEMCDGSQATRKLQRIQSALKLNPLHIDQQVIPVQFQAGIASSPYDSANGETLVQIATTRMRTLKANKHPAKDHALVKDDNRNI